MLRFYAEQDGLSDEQTIIDMRFADSDVTVEQVFQWFCRFLITMSYHPGSIERVMRKWIKELDADSSLDISDFIW